MDRRIVLIRHVSSPHPSGTSDFERPIDEEGREDAARIVAHLEENGWLPDRILVSEARRARETWEAMCDASSRGAEAFDVDFERTLYGADVDEICEAIWALPNEVGAVAVVAHNPGLSDAASWFSGVRSRLPKGGVAILETRGDTWSEAAQNRTGRLESFIRPAELHTTPS